MSDVDWGDPVVPAPCSVHPRCERLGLCDWPACGDTVVVVEEVPRCVPCGTPIRQPSEIRCPACGSPWDGD